MPSGSTFHLVGGNLALDFVNTVANRLREDQIRDDLETVNDVYSWAEAAGLPRFEQGKTRPRITHRDLARVQTVREKLYSIFRAIARGETPSSHDFKTIDASLRDCRGKECLRAEKNAIRWAWSKEARGADFVVCPVLSAAASLLTSAAARAIKECADPHCGWLFLDRSQAARRRWCRMADCGNRAKARKHYLRSIQSK